MDRQIDTPGRGRRNHDRRRGFDDRRRLDHDQGLLHHDRPVIVVLMVVVTPMQATVIVRAMTVAMSAWIRLRDRKRRRAAPDGQRQGEPESRAMLS